MRISFLRSSPVDPGSGKTFIGPWKFAAYENVKFYVVMWVATKMQLSCSQPQKDVSWLDVHVTDGETFEIADLPDGTRNPSLTASMTKALRAIDGG